MEKEIWECLVCKEEMEDENEMCKCMRDYCDGKKIKFVKL